jgi:hypothetical protein
MSTEVSAHYVQNQSPVVSGENARRLLAMWLGEFKRRFTCPLEVYEALLHARYEDGWLPSFRIDKPIASALSVAYQQLPTIEAEADEDDTPPNAWLRYASPLDILANEAEADYWQADEAEAVTPLNEADSYNVGVCFEEYKADIRRYVAGYYWKEGLSRESIDYATDYTLAECCAYACEQVARGSLDSQSLVERKRWFGLARSVRNRYFGFLMSTAPSGQVDNATDLELITGRVLPIADERRELSAEELDYVIGITADTPDWVIDTVSALLAYPDATDEERADALSVSHVAFRKRLQRTREYFLTRG